MKKEIYITEKADKNISWFVGFYFIASTANMTMKTVLPIPENQWGMVSAFWGVLILLFMLRGAKYVLQRSNRMILYSLFAFAILYAWSFFLITSRGETSSILTMEIALPAIMFWLPVGIFASSVVNYEILYRTLLKSSYILTILLVLCFLFRNGIAGQKDASNYNMFFGYTMAFASLFQLNEYYKSKDRKLFLLFVLQLILIVLYANRGALLSVCFFVFMKRIFEEKNKSTRFLWICSMVFVGIFLMQYSETIAGALLEKIGSYNLDSRTLEKMALGTIGESEARDELRLISMRMIGERPVLGWGIGGECYTLGNKYAVGLMSHAASPHNGILQHWLYFGIFLGTIVNIALIAPIYKMHKIRDRYRHDIIMVACSAYYITTLITSCDLLLKPAVAIYLYLSYFKNTNAYERVFK